MTQFSNLPPIPHANIVRHVAQLARIGNLGASAQAGFLRTAWSDEESAAFEYIRHDAQQAGFRARHDAVGNLYLTLPGAWDQIVWTGSHLDTVAAGGNYDGAAGVIAGLEALNVIYTSGVPLRKGVGLVLWRGEEGSSFQQAYKGSLAAFGQLPASCLPSPLSPANPSFTLADAIRSQKNPLTGVPFAPALIAEGQPALSAQDRERIAAFVELHIEQANKLEQDGDDIGIVTSIRGPARYDVMLTHPAYHDLLLARIIVALDQLARESIAAGLDLVQTFGVINLQHVPSGSELRHCARTKVPGYAEVRLQASSKTFPHLLAEIAEEFRVEIKAETTSEGDLLRLYGAFDHSGATPMGKVYRRDANLAAAHLLVRCAEQDPALRASINYSAPNQGQFVVDIRSNQHKAREAYEAQFLALLDQMKHEFQLQGETSLITRVAPVEQLDPVIQDVIRTVCRDAGYRCQALPSGAGHDASIVAKQTHRNGAPIPVGMIFIPCRDGRSHCKEEFATPAAILTGANALASTLYRLAS